MKNLYNYINCKKRDAIWGKLDKQPWYHAWNIILIGTRRSVIDCVMSQVSGAIRSRVYHEKYDK